MRSCSVACRIRRPPPISIMKTFPSGVPVRRAISPGYPETDAGGIHRRLVVGTADDRIDGAFADQTDGGVHIGHGGASGGGLDLAWPEMWRGQGIDGVEEDLIVRRRTARERCGIEPWGATRSP